MLVLVEWRIRHLVKNLLLQQFQKFTSWNLASPTTGYMMSNTHTRARARTPFNSHLPCKPRLASSVLILNLHWSLSWPSSNDTAKLSIFPLTESLPSGLLWSSVAKLTASSRSNSVLIRLHHIPMVKTIVFANIIIIIILSFFLSLFLPKRSLADKHETYTGMDPKLT